MDDSEKPKWKPCEHCNGHGKSSGLDCSPCGGTGIVPADQQCFCRFCCAQRDMKKGGA